MQHVSYSIPQPQTNRGGGRIASAQYRQSLSMCKEFAGLEVKTNRYQLLLLVKQAGKAAGFTSRMIQLLDYYMAFTRDIDWEQGSRPIVYQSMARTALDLGVSERQVQRLEQELFVAGAITWNDSGNHKRYGQRDGETGAILHAYGVELTPLAYLQVELREKLQQKRLHDAAWLETKRQISWYRRQIRSILLEWEQGNAAHASDWQHFLLSYERIAVQIRTHIKLDELRRLLVRHNDLHTAMLAEAESSSQDYLDCGSITEESSSRGAGDGAHSKTFTQESLDCSPTANCFQVSVARTPVPSDPISASGIQHVALKHVLQAASDRFRAQMPVEPRPLNWQDVVEAAGRLRPELHVSQASWGEACEVLGRAGAALCLLVTDQAALRDCDPARRSAAYFRGMVNKARRGELRLHNSIFGLVERNREGVAIACDDGDTRECRRR